MKTRVKWVEGRTFIGETESGHKIVLGTATQPGGLKPGPSPMELVLIGAGGCAAIDVIMILERGREAIEDCVVEVDGTRADTDPKVYTSVHVHFIVKGRNLAEGKVQRATELSVEKYCSALATLAKTATITHDFEIIETAGA
jgi:putative redox protein